MAPEWPSALLLGDRPRAPADPVPNRIVVSAPHRAPTLAAAGHLVCAAAPTALPFRPASLHHAEIERSVRADQLPDVVDECARALEPSGRLVLETRVRFGGSGSWRWLLARVLGSPAPERPEALARLLLLSGFDRIEQTLRGTLARCAGRRLPGRS